MVVVCGHGRFPFLLVLKHSNVGTAVGARCVQIAHAIRQSVKPMVPVPFGINIFRAQGAARRLGQGLNQVRAAVGEVEAGAIARDGVGQ